MALVFPFPTSRLTRRWRDFLGGNRKGHSLFCQVDYLSVRDFAKHQHYRDRNPTWIKLYNSVMDDENFLELSDAARSHLLLIFLLASRRGNKIPNDAKLIGRAIQSSSRVNLVELQRLAFLVPYDESHTTLPDPEERASNVLAKPEQIASPEREGERKGKTENKELFRDAEKAWDSLLAIVPDWHAKRWTAERHAALPDRSKRGLSKVGGFPVIAATPEEKRVWLKRDFITAYNG